jgi:hypothetical protein
MSVADRYHMLPALQSQIWFGSRRRIAAVAGYAFWFHLPRPTFLEQLTALYARVTLIPK